MKYVPILRGKQGEHSALETLANEVKQGVTPLIQVVPDDKLGRDKKEYQEKRVKELQCWSFKGSQMFLDVFELKTDNVSALGFYDGIRSNGTNVIPVIRSNSSKEYVEALVDRAPTSICFRAVSGDFEPAELYTELVSILEKFKIGADGLHLLIDFGYVGEAHLVQHLTNSYGLIIQALSQLPPLASVIVASGSFPKDLGALAPGLVHILPRHEFRIWNEVKKSDVLDSTPLVYADYGAVHPVIPEDKTPYEGSCSIKYTKEDSFLVFRGIRPSDHADGGKQYYAKAKEVVNHPDYMGRDFSWGDKYIFERADKQGGPGNSTNWVSVAQSHHITLINSLN